jgi:AcrR family transcriptional regulator
MTARSVAATGRMAGEERRALIARVAGRLFARDGYAATRIDDIAAAAGVTKPIVYRHFESKKALYMALLAKHEADLPTFFERVRGESAELSPDERIRAVLEHWFDYVRENQHAWVMLFRDSSGDEEIRALRRRVGLRARALMAGFVAEQSDGRIPAAEVEPTGEALRAGLAGLALWSIDHPDVPKPVLVDVGARLLRAPLLEG